ncbi:acyl-CoA dehydrogenase family protein [Candidatus Uabimicrobium amorphum]|uniref:acyl-CoA oxidase n=1 Tax=Uabimicrobium amorphum TaxID=2596890 RepID=A0A5S9F560_UABAM|nr:acyl-CoA dehydrogenase [Candidatus Uabimicrobium amorphum]BBM86496.1 acyl-CoA oxidase [Candidatus Uabimicrobium amorphum]
MHTSDVIIPSNERLLPILPMIYVAWSNNVLTPSEIEKIRAKMATMEWLQEDDSDILQQWLDPRTPPSPEQMQAWLIAIRENAKSQTDTSRRTLADLGAEIASIGGDNPKIRCTSKELCEALNEVEKALYVVGPEARKEILTQKITREKFTEKQQPQFNIDEMTDFLDGEYAELHQKIKNLLRDPMFKFPEKKLTTAEHREQVRKWCAEISKQGWGALFYPESYGGKSDLARFIVMMKNLAFHDLSLVVKVGVQFGLFGGSVFFLGTKYHHDKYLARIGDMECMGCFAMTEEGHGSNVRDLETTAHYDRKTQQFIINTPSDSARKEYIGNAACDGMVATVFAQLIIQDQPFGVHAFIVPIRDKDKNIMPGVRIEDCGEKMGLNGVDNGRIWFNDVRIPRENLLDRFAQVAENGKYTSSISSASQRFFTMLSTLVAGRISIGAASVTVAKTGLTIAVRYAEKRRQFGPAGEKEISILHYPTHQKRLIPLIANAYALDFSLQYLTRRYAEQTPEDTREIEVLAAGLKAYASWNATHTIQTCRECCGGQGYLAENRFADLKADSDIFTTFEGDNTVLMQLVAKGLLADLKQQFHEMNWWSMVKYIANQAAVAVIELNPITTRNTDEEHLRSASFHAEALRYREKSLLMSVAKRLKHRIENGMDSFEAFIECQNHLVSLANACMERVICERFQHEINTRATESNKPILEKLCALFSLNCIAKDRGWYLESGYVEVAKSKEILRQVSKICLELKPQAVHLVNAFAIPSQCVAAPIAK